MIIDDSVITGDGIVDTLDNVSIDSINKKAKYKIILLLTRFVSNHIVVNNCYYLLLLHKALVKTKRHFTTLIYK